MHLNLNNYCNRSFNSTENDPVSESEHDKIEVDRIGSWPLEFQIDRKDALKTLKLSQIINFLGGEKLHKTFTNTSK